VAGIVCSNDSRLARHGTTNLSAPLEIAGGELDGHFFNCHTRIAFLAFLESLAKRYTKCELYPDTRRLWTDKHLAVTRWLTPASVCA